MKREAILAYIDACFWIHSKSQLQCLSESRLYLPHQLESGSKLAVDREPAHLGRLAQGMKAVSEPDVNVYGQAA